MKLCVRLGVMVGLVLCASPVWAISESSVVTATNTASVATVTVSAAASSVLVALISGDGPNASSSQTTTVGGCGQTWVLVNRANTRPGVADVWKTATSTVLSSCAVTGRLVSGSFFVRLTVVVLGSAGTVGASTAASGTSGAAKAMLTSVQAGSLVYGVGSDWSVVQARTVLGGQRTLAESTPAGLGTFWAQALNGTSVAGSLTVGTSAPSSTNWNFAAVEILAGGAPPPPPPPTTLVITCPSNRIAVSIDGLPVAVSYPPATTTGGVAPITVTGTPASGSAFAVGATTVTQAASSSDGQAAQCPFLVTVTYTPPPAPGSGGLLHAADLVYLGDITVPTGIHSGGTANAGFEYGGTALAFNPTRNSLFLTGHDWDQFTGEISIPALGSRATLLQPLRDISEGKANAVNPSSTNQKKVGGHLVWNGQLVFTIYDYYDGSGTQVLSHFVRPLSLSTTGQVKGPYRVGDWAGIVSGYMTPIPAAWQALLGGPALTGQCCIPIASRTSLGPAASSFDPAQVGVASAVPATHLVHYDLSHPTLGGWNGVTPYYSGVDQVTGIVFPEGSSTVLFFGRHGTTFCYGGGTSQNPPPAGLCYDPTSSDKGSHGYPYFPQVWAYDANDLAKVKAGTKQPWEIVPYAVWHLQNIGDRISGAAYDPATKRLYVSELRGEDVNPRIRVYLVNVP